MRNRSLISAFLLAVTVFALNSCSQKVILNGTSVYTTDKQPVPDALVYVEIWEKNKPIDFTFGITASGGIIPPEPVIPVPMGRRAMAAMAVFADGLEPTVFSRAIVEGKYQRKELTVNAKSDRDVITPGKLAFPFDEYPHLLKILKDPVFKPLVIQWIKEWSFIFDKVESLPLHLRKRIPNMKDAIDELKKSHGIH